MAKKAVAEKTEGEKHEEAVAADFEACVKAQEKADKGK